MQRQASYFYVGNYCIYVNISCAVDSSIFSQAPHKRDLNQDITYYNILKTVKVLNVVSVLIKAFPHC